MKLSGRKTAVAATVAAAFAAASGAAGAAGFALIEQSGSGMGNSFAGAAAVAEDASTIFFNPAGMSYLQGEQAAVAAHVISVSSEFSGTATNPAALPGPATGGTGGDAGDTAFVPNLYLAKPLGERWHFGLGASAPFGLKTEYDSNWIGRFQGIKSELTTININPSVSYKVTDAFSIGGGLNYQRADAELTNAVVLPVVGPGRTKLEADDDAWGWNVGAIFQVTPATRIGVAYRSEIDYTLEGDVTTTTSTGAVFADGSGPSRAEITFPDMLSLSVVHAVSDRLQLLADVTHTGWSSIRQIRVVNTTDGTLREVLNFDFDDASRYSVGANYKWGDTWTLKVGLAFDETPVKNATTRTVRLPDSDRTWISIGGQRMVGKNGRLDLGYAHLFIDDADINNTRSQQLPGQTTPTPAAGTDTTVTGTYKASVDIFSIQYTHNF